MGVASSRMEARVVRKCHAAQDIALFELEALNGGALPSFSAGSHIDVFLGDSLVRQYSLCNAPDTASRYEICVLREPASRGGSAAMHALTEGDTVHISEPRNHFSLAKNAPHSLLLAAGIGVTPILSMAQRLNESNAPFTMHYCAKSPERAAFVDRLTGSAFADRVHLHYSAVQTPNRLDIGALLAQQPAGTHLYVCGPQRFIDSVLEGARALGWQQDRLHYEFFSAEVQSRENDCAFEIQLASSGRIIQVGPTQTVTDALQAAGVAVMTSCEQGVCGTCLTRVVRGEPDHRDAYLTAEERAANDQFLPCCSRSRSQMLVLDL